MQINYEMICTRKHVHINWLIPNDIMYTLTFAYKLWNDIMYYEIISCRHKHMHINYEMICTRKHVHINWLIDYWVVIN